jgi:hypothetical protein
VRCAPTPQDRRDHDLMFNDSLFGEIYGIAAVAWFEYELSTLLEFTAVET